jgi:hypothetical protein
MAIMRSTDFRSIVEPILSEEFDGVYKQRKDEWKAVFKVEEGTKRSYHEEPVLYGMGAAPELPDGAAVTYDTGGVLFVKRYTYSVYGLAFALTKVLVEDGDHIKIGQIFSRHLAQSLIETKETVTSNVFNRAFNGSYVGGDNVSLSNASHPVVGSTFSNILPTAAALSQTSLEQILIQLRSAVDNNGKRITLDATKLIVPPALMMQAEVLLKSALRTGTANNDINPLKGKLSDIAVISRLTSSTAWWVQTDATEGLKMLTRRNMEKSMEGDFETDSMRYKATERYTVGWTDPRCVYGTPGL